MGEDTATEAMKRPETERGLTPQAFAVYVILLIASCVALVLASYFRQIGDLILIIPMIILQLAAIVTDRQEVHVPPLIIVLMVATFFLSFLGLGFRNMDQVGFLASILQGVNLMMIGLVVLYALMRGHPSSMNSPMVIFISECVAIAIFTMMKVVQFYVSEYWDPMSPVSIDRLMEEMLGVFIGSLLIGVLFLFDTTQRQFEYLLNTFMRGSKKRGNEIAPTEVMKQEALRLMREGESGKVEFKSTMRVNLETKERDKRMEKAVLKTLVAYLNTDGGVLLVGVDDAGNPRGLEEDNFENVDKMNLHLTHMITNAIGDEFLPYIWFTVLDFDGKQVVMISCDRCKKPVFYREGKTEEFYVRSGPSSIVLTGKSLVNYVSNRSKKARGKILDEARLEGLQRSDPGIFQKMGIRKPARRRAVLERDHSFFSLRAFLAFPRDLAIRRVMMTARMVTMIAYTVSPARSSSVPKTAATACLIASFHASAATSPNAAVMSAANVSSN